MKIERIKKKPDVCNINFADFWDTQYNYGHIVCQAQRAEKCQD